MKKKFILLLLITGLMFGMNAQTVFHEGFTAPFNPAAAGWDVQNVSSPTGTNVTGWFQGTAARFNGVVTGPNDYYAADMDATSSAGTTNTISCWLITPTLSLVNGGILQFATRGSSIPAKADRMQVYYSLAGNGNNVGPAPGTTTNSAGTFTNILFDFNASMSGLGYINEWVVITLTLSGIPAPTVGRIGFRYYVPDGGASGPNGNYIGLDEVRYSLPCPYPNFWVVQGPVTPCTNAALTVSLTNLNPANALTSYTWGSGANTSSLSVTPTHTGINEYYAVAETAPGCFGLDIGNIYVVPSPTVTYTLNPGNALCSNESLTVTASGGTSYTYALGATSASTLNPILLTAPPVTNSTVINFTLTGKGSTNSCRHSQVVTLTVNPVPTVSVSLTKNTICTKSTVSLTASGAATYSWSGAASSTANPLPYIAGATAGVQHFTLSGISAQGCKSADVVTTLTVSACAGITNLNGDDMGLSVYPNPFSDQLHFNGFTGKIEIYNAMGQRVLEHNAEDLKLLDTARLPAGVYFLQATNTLGKRSFRLIKH